MATASSQIASFIAKFDPANAKLIRTCRSAMRRRLPTATTLAEPEVEQLICAALVQAKTPMPAAGRGRTIVKSISAKQRPRRAVQR